MLFVGPSSLPYLVGFVGPEMAANPPPLRLAEIDSIPDQQMPPGMKLSLKMSLRRFGVDSLADWLERLCTFRIGVYFRTSAVRALLWWARARARSP